MLSENELIELCSKYRTHRITEAEYGKLREWLNESEENYRFFSNYVKYYKVELRAEALQKTDSALAWRAIERKRKSYRARRRLYILAAAACFLAVVIAGAVYLNFYKEEVPVIAGPIALAEAFPDLPKNKVTLTLSSGEQIVLDKDSIQAISDNGMRVANGTNTSLDYQHAVTDGSALAYNTVTVPEGSTFTLTLSDGTQVTLNSSSVFRYPVAFRGDRCVELIGEAFFDVIHDGSPFMVKVDNKEIKVLGTRFNISGYREKDMVTTLVEGKVEVKYGESSKQLLAGEQATVDERKGSISVAKVDTEIYTSWMTGKYDFAETPLRTILSQLALWYGVEVVYKDPHVQDICFDGTVFRNKSLGFSLEIIRQVSDVEFERKDGVIIVSERK